MCGFSREAVLKNVCGSDWKSERDAIGDKVLERIGRYAPNVPSSVDGLYLCGSGTHPGSGVTGAPGYNAAQRILQNRARFVR